MPLEHNAAFVRARSLSFQAQKTLRRARVLRQAQDDKSFDNLRITGPRPLRVSFAKSVLSAWGHFTADVFPISRRADMADARRHFRFFSRASPTMTAKVGNGPFPNEFAAWLCRQSQARASDLPQAGFAPPSLPLLFGSEPPVKKPRQTTRLFMNSSSSYFGITIAAQAT